GEPIGIIETALPTTSIAQSLQNLVRTLLGIAIGVAVLAALASFLPGQRLRQPLQALTTAAARIGRGDLDTPIVVSSGGEIGALVTTLEDMRWRLMRLTTALRRH